MYKNILTKSKILIKALIMHWGIIVLMFVITPTNIGKTLSLFTFLFKKYFCPYFWNPKCPSWVTHIKWLYMTIFGCG